MMDFIFNFPPLLIVVVISLIVSLLIVVIYKLVTNQKEMKDMKDKLKEYQKEMKELKDEPKKMMEVQKKAMALNMQYMKHSLKPTLITFIPIILIFGFLNGGLAYEPISAGDTFTTIVTFEKGAVGNISLINVNPEEFTLLSESVQEIRNRQAVWELKAEKNGNYLLEYEYNKEVKTKEILVTSEQKYVSPVRKIKDSQIQTITINHNPLKVLNLGIFNLGWVWTYILFSIILSMGLRKLMKVY